MPTRMPLLLLLLLLVACESVDPVERVHDASLPEANIVVTPAVLDFGDVTVGAWVTAEFRVANEGVDAFAATLALSEVEGAFSMEDFDVALEPDVFQRMEVTFTPMAWGSAASTLSITADGGAAAVSLVGVGVGPKLVAEEDPVVLGEMVVGCPVHGTVQVRNADAVDANVELFTFADPVFTVDGGGATIAAAATISVEFTATPATLGESVGTLVAETAEGGLYVGQVSVTGVVATSQLESFEIGYEDADILVVLDPGLPEWVDVAGGLAELAEVTTGLHRMAVTIADDGCVPGGYIDSATADAADALEGMLEVLAGALGEKGFLRLLEALSPAALAPGGCNEGFLRDSAALYVIAITDSSERSMLWTSFVAAVSSLKVDPDDVIVSVAAGEYPSGCLDIAGAGDWYEASVATDGLYVSLCETDWVSDFKEDLGERFAHDGRFELSDFPDPATMHVYVDGVEVTTGWTYADVDNAVDFGDAPPEGSIVEVRYDLPRGRG